METIKVNMSPNPLDVQTIHASQNDTEARQWEFELHNNGDVIDSSEVTDQMVFKAYKGGTEQLLPENTSTPTTSPFKGDIRYPQGLLTDQEFTYRQSPTEEDGLAKITDIKGNTLVWNQLLQNGNFESTTGWSQNDTANTLSVASNEMTVTVGNPIYTTGFYGLQMHDRIANHKYLFVVSVYSPIVTTFAFGNTNDGIHQNVSVGWNTLYAMVTNTVTVKSVCCYLDCRNLSAGSTFKVKNYQAFDLTQMGLDITSPSDFTSLFPLSYYSYNQGSLLSFNGNGIKTVGKNQCNADDVQVGKAWNNTSNSSRATLFVPIQPNTQYTISITSLGTVETTFVAEESRIGIAHGISVILDNATKSLTFTSKSDSKYIALQCNKTAITKSDFESVKFMVEYGATETSYEPYTSSTLSLPISTYFPTGMKSAGNVYDEWTPSKASSRVGTVTLNGTESWHEPDSSGNCWMNFNNMPVVADYRLTMTATVTVAQNRQSMTANSVTGYNSGTTNYLYFRTADATQSAANVKAYLQANPVTVNYELKTPTETSFTTASLVTENAEIPLSNNDGVLIGKCTEELSAEPGFHDAKIKLSDSDGECYSNKIQLHVERSPQ